MNNINKTEVIMKKKNFIKALFGTIVLVSAMLFTGCTSDDNIDGTSATTNSTYDADAQTVTAQFVLNVSSAANSNTSRQSATIVQKNSNFRGLKDAKLIGLSTGKSEWLAPFAGNSTGYAVKKTYDLGTLYGTTEVDNTGNKNRDNSSRRVLQLTLPLQTDAMLVYARAIPVTPEDAEANGKVNINMDEDPEDITFDLVSRIGARNGEYTETCNLAALIFNRILLGEVPERTDTYTHNTVSNTGTLPALSWRGLAGQSGLLPLQENMATIYKAITTLRDGEVRAGSASAISSIVLNIKEAMDITLSAKATSDAELNAQRLAAEINARIGYYFDVTSTTATFKDITDVKDALINVAHVMSESEYNTKFGHVVAGELRGFPTSFNLPLGSAQLYFTAFNAAGEGGFSYNNPSTSLLNTGTTLDVTHYMYPAELLYFDNSPLFVSDIEKKDNNTDYPNGYKTWNEYSWTTNGWTRGAVASTTRSVAVKNNINYGVAMLQTKVQLDGTSFPDNRHAIVSTEADQVFTVADVEKFQLTGVIIGGQNHQMGWNYLAKANDGTDWDYAIYDNSIPSGVIPTGAGNENYTLVFDNYNSTSQKNVRVALEFLNNSKDFYGKGNLVRKGAKFYLIGELELGSKAITAWDTYYPIPPYDASGESQKISRIFVQDFMTTATFKIGAGSLKKAFVTMPDLRSTQTSLGLSVDLNWQTGLSFETTLGL